MFTVKKHYISVTGGVYHHCWSNGVIDVFNWADTILIYNHHVTNSNHKAKSYSMKNSMGNVTTLGLFSQVWMCLVKGDVANKPAIFLYTLGMNVISYTVLHAESTPSSQKLLIFHTKLPITEDKLCSCSRIPVTTNKGVVHSYIYIIYMPYYISCLVLPSYKIMDFSQTHALGRLMNSRRISYINVQSDLD